MNESMRTISFIVILVLAGACGTSKTWHSKSESDWKQYIPDENAKLIHAIYLIGDGGNPGKEELEPALELLQHKLQHDDAPSIRERSVVFLGDNVYDKGLPPEDGLGRRSAEQKLTAQLNIVKEHPGKRIMLPGNHDWNIMMKGGWEYIVRQQQFVDQYLNDSTVYYPKGGCPGPVEVNLKDNISIIILDTEWWLYKHERPYGENSPCNARNESELIAQLKDLVQKNKDRHTIVAMHHPLYSNGNHGGYFSFKEHIFPLTILRKNLYLPLPIVGSLLPLVRKCGISREDISNRVYKKLRNSMMDVLEDQPKLTVASGHDHSLQLLHGGGIHHIISGAAVKKNHAARGGNALFIGKVSGFSIIKYYDNGDAWVEFWMPTENNFAGELIFKKRLYATTASQSSDN